MSMLPILNSRCSTFIRPLKPEVNEPPLKLCISHGRRVFKVKLRLADNENGSSISMRHLAQAVLHETGIVPHEQRYCFRGVTWKNPDLGPWSPALRDLGLKNGDRIRLECYHHAIPDWEAVEKQEILDKRFNKLKAEVHSIFYTVHGVHQGFVESGNQLMSLANIRQAADTVKEKLMVLIKDLNALHLDHRNYEGQARRREAVDSAQRQIDKCVDLSASIFHKLAQSQQLAQTGRLFHADPMLTMARSRGNPKRRS